MSRNEQLPVSATRLEARPFRIDIYRPPHVPEVNVSDDLYRHLPLVAGVAAEYITARATEREDTRGNEIRVFFYNLMAVNDFRNRDFDDLIGLIALNIDAIIHRKRLHDEIERVIRGEVPVMVDVITAAQTIQYRELESFYDDRDIDQFRDGHRQFDKMVDIARDHTQALKEAQRRDDRGGRDRGYDRDRRDDRRDYDRRDYDDRRGGGRGYDRGDTRGMRDYQSRMAQQQSGGRDMRRGQASYRDDRPRQRDDRDREPAGPIARPNPYARMCVEQDLYQDNSAPPQPRREEQRPEPQREERQPTVTVQSSPQPAKASQNDEPKYTVDPTLNQDDDKLCTLAYKSPFEWFPSKLQWTPPTWHPDQVPVHRVKKSGQVVIEIYNRDDAFPRLTFFEEQIGMDFTRHALPGSIKQAAAKPSSQEQAERAIKMVQAFHNDRKLAREAEDTIEPTPSKDTLDALMKEVVVDDRQGLDTSDLSMVTYADLNKRRYQQSQADREQPILAYRSYFAKTQSRVMDDPKLVDEVDDQSAFLDQLRAATTYKQLAFAFAKMKTDEGCDMIFYKMINDRILAMVNRHLRYNLSIPNLNLSGEFDVATATEVEQIIQREMGDNVLQKFHEYASKIIDKVFAHDTDIEILNEQFDTADMGEVQIQHLLAHHSVTLINLSMAELGLRVDEAVGSVLSVDSGLLYYILQEIGKKADATLDNRVYRHLIRLADGVMLEVFDAHLVKGTKIVAFASDF